MNTTRPTRRRRDPLGGLVTGAVLLMFVLVYGISQLVTVILAPRNEGSSLSMLSQSSADYQPWTDSPLLPAIPPAVPAAVAADRNAGERLSQLTPTPGGPLPVAIEVVPGVPGAPQPTSVGLDVTTVATAVTTATAALPTSTARPRPSAPASPPPTAAPSSPPPTAGSIIVVAPTLPPSPVASPPALPTLALPTLALPTLPPSSNDPQPTSPPPTAVVATALPSVPPASPFPTTTPVPAVPPKPTRQPATATPVPPPTTTPVPPSTATPVPPPTATPSVAPPSSTPTRTWTPTLAPPSNTPTRTRVPTPIPPSNTPTRTGTATPTYTPTAVPPSVVKTPSHINPVIDVTRMSFFLQINNTTTRTITVNEMRDNLPPAFFYEDCSMHINGGADIGQCVMLNGDPWALWPSGGGNGSLVLLPGEYLEFNIIGTFIGMGGAVSGKQECNWDYYFRIDDNVEVSGASSCVTPVS